MATSTPPTPPAGPDLVDSLRALRRSRDNRVVAGVCGGVARRLGVDPLLLRVVLVVLAIFGGVGIVVYAAAWLLIPEDGAPVSLGEQAIGRGPSRAGTGTIVLAIVLGIVVVGALIDGFGGWQWGLLLALAVGGFLLLLERSRGFGSPPPYAPASPDLPPPVPQSVAVGFTPAQPPAAGSPAAGSPVPESPESAVTSPTVTSPLAADAPAAEASTRPVPPYAGGPQLPPPPPPTGPSWAAVPPVPPPPPVRRERSALFGLTASATVLALGVLGLVDVAGASVPGGAYWATGLAVVGLGLVVGAWIGRSRMLIVAGILLALGLSGAVAVHNTPDVRHVSVHPTSLPAAGLTKDYKTGDVRYDLTDVDFTGLDTNVTLDLGVGTLTVVVPDDVAVSLHAEAGVGEVNAFGTTHGGFGNDVDLNDPASSVAPDTGSLRLDLSTGVGTVEVRRG